MNRILVFSLAYHPHIGGAEVAVSEIAARVTKGAYAFDVITAQLGPDKREERVGGAWVYRVGWHQLGPLNKALYPFLAVRTALALHKEKPYDLSWIIMAAYAGVAGVLFSFFKPKVPFVLTLQEGDPIEFIEGRMRLIWPLFTRMFTRATHVTAISHFLAGWARRRRAETVTVVPNGVDLARFSGFDRKSARRALALDERQQVIVTTSRLVRKNGVDTVIRALASIPDALFVVAGDGPLRGELERLAEKVGVAARVRFLGAVPYEKVHEVVAAADVFVRASRSEGMGNSFIEAMALGVPVVGTPVGGIPDFLTDAIQNPTHGTGLSVPPDSPHRLAGALVRLLSDTSLRTAVANRARAFVRERYDWNRIAGGMEVVFKDALSTAAKPRVLIATGLFPPESGGPATYSKTLLDELPARGFRVSVLPFRRVRALPPGVRHLAYFFLVLRRSYGVDIVFAQDPFSAGFPAAIAARIARRKFVLKIVGDYAWEQARQRFGYTGRIESFQTSELGMVASTMRSIERWVARRAALVVTPSEYLKNIITLWGIPKEQITVVYNGVAISEVGLKQVIRGLLRFKGELVVSPGRLVPWKGFEALIRVHAALSKKRPGLTLLIVGAGPDLKRLEAFAETLGVGASVIFAGSVENAVALRYMRAADVFALNTSYEGFSHVLLEASGVGVPIVTTTVGGNPELIEDGVNGYLVKPDDEKALAARISALLDSPELRARIAGNAKRRVERFSVQHMVDETAQVLKSVL